MKKLLCLLLLLCLLTGCSKPQATVADTNGDGRLTCTLTVRCDTLLSNLERLSPAKAALVPKSGCLLAETEVEFSAGETVFDVFRRVLRQEKLHFEYTDGSLYGSVYIEGIGNLYELDCGAQSGWMFCVNGIYPSVGCASYTLADGDVIVFAYTCDLGADLGVPYEE